jgi:murein DD-endopeptidase MepM/ murein hydrolase activator NlpD
MGDWRKTAKTIFATAAVTSVVWLTVGAVLLSREQLAGLAPSRSAAPQAFVQQRRQAPARPLAPAGTAPMVIPVAGIGRSHLVDTFTQARAGGARVHDAIDILAPRGTPVVAAAPGTVEKLFDSADGGKTVYVRSPGGTLIYYYAHLDTYAPGLAEGRAVRAGEPIGTVGFTGNANPAAPHLHFSVQRTTPAAKWYEPSTPLNPYPLLSRR